MGFLSNNFPKPWPLAKTPVSKLSLCIYIKSTFTVVESCDHGETEPEHYFNASSSDLCAQPIVLQCSPGLFD